jgi:hypothetical protein
MAKILKSGCSTKFWFNGALVISFSILYTLFKGKLPQFWIYATDPNFSNFERLLSSPIHLADDVMVSARAGDFVNLIGKPSFNLTDQSQPSTSLLAPYLFAILAKVFPDDLAILAYACIGFFLTILTFSIILLKSKSFTNGVVLVLALTITTTNLQYSLNGWDHLFQAAFLVASGAIILSEKSSNLRLILAALLLTLSNFARMDGLLISIALIVAAYMRSQNRKKLCFALIVPYTTGILMFLILNYLQFSTFTPTTARLKIGGSPGVVYDLKYVFNNSLFEFSAITIVFALLFLIFANNRSYKDKTIMVISTACLLTSVIASANSDVFTGGRMYWSSACVLALLIAMTHERVLKISVSSKYTLPKMLKRQNLQIFAIVWVLAFTANNFTQLVNSSLVRESNLYSSAEAQQFKIVKWIEGNLEKEDGAVGFFYLGLSYHLPSYEAADFLGKADEVIAKSKKKWGPPGHNKWSIDTTLENWNPQAIIPARNLDFSEEEVIEQAMIEYKARVDFGFAPALILNANVRMTYDYCYLRPSYKDESTDNWGFLLRKDLVKLHYSTLSCQPSS